MTHLAIPFKIHTPVGRKANDALNVKLSRKQLAASSVLIPSKILWKTLISMSFQLDFVKSIFFSVQFQLICQSKCFVLPFSHVSSLDLEHRFCGKMSESEITNMHIDFGLNSKIFHKWGVDFKWDSPLSQNFLLFPLFFRGSEVPHVVLVLSFEKAW